MYTTSQNYKNYIKEPSRMFESKIILGSITLNNDDVIQLKTELQQPSNGFTLGSCISKSLELTLKNDGGTYASAGVLDVSIGLKMGEIIEYIPQGLFNIDTVEKTDYTVKITAYDNMIKFETPYSEKYDNPTLKQVIQQLQDITGVEFDSSVTIPSYTLNKLSGYTCREILGYVASLMGGNAYITRNGKFTIVTPVEVNYTITADNYFDYDIEDNTYKIGMLTCQNKLKNDAVDESDDYEAIEEKNTISVGSLGTDNMELTFINPWMTETILNSIYNKLKSFSFLGYSIKWQGDLSIDVGNIINVTDRHGVTRKALVFSDRINYNGGLTQETRAKGQTKSSNEFSTMESPTELDRISVKLLLAEKAIIQKANINDLTVVSAKVGTLDAGIANINSALINYAKVDDLNATNANINNLNAQYANLSSAIINKADIAELNAANANISKLQATVADIGELKSTVADISTLVSGNLTSSNIHSLVLTTDKVTVQNGFIKNAMVESLAADKITSGTLNTNKLNIASGDGGLVLANNTIQFSDKDKNVRVQIGQDAKGDFNFIVKGTDGKTVLLDSTGLHEGAISDGLIKTDMIADNSIISSKINYSSFISGLNDDGSNYINASKVAIDLTGQTLDIAFNSVKSTADSANDKIDNLSIGGRNLLINSNFSSNKNFWSDWGAPSIREFVTLGDKKWCHIKGSGTALFQGISQNTGIQIDKNTQYTFSAKVKANSEKQIFTIGIHWCNSINSILAQSWMDFTVSTAEEIIKVVFTSPTSDVSRFNIMLGVNNASIVYDVYFTDVKFEKGAIPTDWTPAPEDVESSISDVKSLTETNTTSISAIQGQISTLISNTTVIVDGKEKTLKDAYNGTVQTVNSINTTIGEHTSTLNTLNGTVNSNSSKITSIQTDLNGIKTSVSSVQSDLNSTKSQLATLNSTLDGFESRVETTETNTTKAINRITTVENNVSTIQTTANSAMETADSANSKIDNLSVGGRNLVENSQTLNNEFVKIDTFNGTKTISEDSSAKSGKVVKIECTTAGKGFFCNLWSGDDSNISKKFTWSFYAKMNTNKTLSNIGHERGGVTSISVTTEWQKFTHTWTYSSSGNRAFIFYPNFAVGDILYIKDFKIEEGNIATDWTPAPEDVEAYTDTQISNAKNDINKTTDNKISNAKTELQEVITTQISSAKSEIKQTTDSIIQSVSSVNSSITTINNTLDTKAEKSTVKSISDSVTSIDTNLSGVTGRVNSLESDTTTLTNKIDNLNVGGRNYIKGGKGDKKECFFKNFATVNNGYGEHRLTSQKKHASISIADGFVLDCRDYEVGEKYTMSYDFMYTEWNFPVGTDRQEFWIGQRYTNEVGSSTNGAWKGVTMHNLPQIGEGGCELNKWIRIKKVLTIPQQADTGIGSEAKIQFYNSSESASASITFRIKNVKIEKGEIATDWTPAPEDAESYTDNKISNAKGEINQATDDKISNAKAELQEVITTQISSAKSEIKQTTDSISQSVSNINSSITTINNTLGNKAEKSTVESISNSVASLNTSLSGITGRVSSLESNTTTLTTTLSNLQVGGTNLLLNTGFNNTNNYLYRWSKFEVNSTESIDEPTAISKKALKIIPAKSKSGIYQDYDFANKFKEGETYTVSFYAKADSESVLISIRENSQNELNFNLTDSWQKFSYSFTQSSNSSGAIIFYTLSGVTFYLHSIKVEKGNMATDWTPAPEDIDNSITTVQEKVTSNTTEISALKNSITLKVDSTEMISYKETVNGQLNTINSNISSMQSSIDLQLNSIKSSVSKTVSTKNLINNSAFNKPLGTYSANGTVNMCEIVPKSTYTSWGNATPPVASDNVLIVRFDVGGDNYVHFKDIFAKVKPSTTYTFSYYCNSTGNITGPSSYLYERTASQSNQIVHTNAISIGPDTTSNGKGWVRKITSFTTRSDTDSVMVRFGFQSTDGATRMLIAGLQLEEGSQATDWVEGNTSSVGTIITQSPTDVMTAFNGISQYFEVSASGAKFGNISTGDYMAFNDRGLVRYIANQERRYIYMVQPRTFTKTLDERKPALTTAQKDVGRTGVWDDLRKNMPKAKDYAQTFTLNYDQELIDLLAGYVPQYATRISTGFTNPSNLSYSGLSSGSQDGVVGEDYITDTYIEVVSMTSTSITFKAGHICCVYEVTVDKTGLMKYYQFKRNYAGGKMTWYGLLFA